MKQFRVDQIITTSSGDVILNGPNGALTINRVQHNMSSANRHFERIDDNPDISGIEDPHVVGVYEIPDQGNIAF